MKNSEFPNPQVRLLGLNLPLGLANGSLNKRFPVDIYANRHCSPWSPTGWFHSFNFRAKTSRGTRAAIPDHKAIEISLILKY
jgi:hypothetical protein